MIAILLLAAVTAVAPAAKPQPMALPSAAPTATAPELPAIERGLALPYPAYGPAQPQIIQTRKDRRVPQFVTLDDATSIAIARVPSLAAARASIDLENAALQLQKTGLAPSVSIAGSSTGSFQQSGSTTTTTTAGASSYTLSNTATLSLAQLIFDGGQIRAKIDAARLTRDASVATLRRDAQQVAYSVATAFYQLLQDERAVAVDDELLRENIVSENLVRAQIRAGTVAGADIATQLATTAESRTTLVSAQGTLQNARVAFATALGLDADIDVLPRDDSQGLQTSTPAITLPSYAAALNIASAERPDVDQARLTVRSSQASLRASQRGLSPTVSFTAGKGIGSASIGGGSFRNNGSVAVDLTIPVYDQGITLADIASSKATVAQATANAATTQLTVEQDVREALIGIVSDRATLDQTRAAYASAVASLRSTQGQYRVGVTTLPSLIQAQATLASAATNIVNSIYSLRLAQVNLRYALGTILQ